MFFLLVPFTSCTMWVWHPFFTQIFSFLPLSVLWVGQWGETCWYWSYRENVLALIGLLSFLWHANSWHNTFFCSPFQNRLFLPITDRELMENIYKVPLATPSQRLYEYLFPEDNPLFRGLFFFFFTSPSRMLNSKVTRMPLFTGDVEKKQRSRRVCPGLHRRQHKKKDAKPSKHQVFWLNY